MSGGGKRAVAVAHSQQPTNRCRHLFARRSLPPAHIGEPDAGRASFRRLESCGAPVGPGRAPGPPIAAAALFQTPRLLQQRASSSPALVPLPPPPPPLCRQLFTASSDGGRLPQVRRTRSRV